MTTIEESGGRTSGQCGPRSVADWAAGFLAAVPRGWVLVVDGVLADVNEAFCALTGYSRAELLGQRAPHPFWPQQDDVPAPGGGAHPDPHWSASQARWVHRDGTAFDVEITAGAVRDTASGQVGVGYLATDVTDARRRAAELATQVLHLRAVAAATHAILTDPDPRGAICGAAQQASGALSVTLLEVRGRRLEATASSGSFPRRTVDRDLDDDSSLLVRVATSGQPVMVDDTQGHAVTDLPGADGALCVPVFAAVSAGVEQGDQEAGGGRTVIGVLAAALRGGPPAGLLEVLEVLEVLAAEAGIAIERADLQRRLAEQARTDGLTGLANRRTWEHELPLMMARARRSGAPLCLAMIDLDRFKAYNDAHGHPAGDDLLRGAAAAWTDALRTTDVLARYGGEEFVLALPDCEPAEALVVLERLRSVVPCGATASIGLTVWDGTEPAEAVVARADSALYRAKRDGRDRVCSDVPAGPPPPSGGPAGAVAVA